jgi:hypothetical protein
MIQANISWALRNGALINIWIDNILGRAPMDKKESLNPLKLWCISNGYFNLQDLSKWTTNSQWIY